MLKQTEITPKSLKKQADVLKRHLRSLGYAVNSAHSIEAAAKMNGYETYAAFLAAVKAGSAEPPRACQNDNICPACQSTELEYDHWTLQDDMLFYRVACGKCEWVGREWWSRSFNAEASDTEKEGVCPECNEKLEYGAMEGPEGTSLDNPVSCSGDKGCGWNGYEYEKLTFSPGEA